MRRSTPLSSPTAPSATSPRRSSTRWSCPATSASTPPGRGQFERTLIIADERHPAQLHGGLHRADARRELAACRRGEDHRGEGRRL